MQYFEQETDYTCGVASLRMALSQFSEQIPEEKVLEQQLLTNDRVGTSPENILKWCSENGYEAFIKEDGTLEVLDNYLKEGYVILLAVSVDVPHWVVYLGNNNNHVFLNDPFFGERQAHSISKFLSKQRLYPFMRWKIKNSEFTKYLPDYDFTPVESNRLYLAIKKK